MLGRLLHMYRRVPRMQTCLTSFQTMVRVPSSSELGAHTQPALEVPIIYAMDPLVMKPTAGAASARGLATLTNCAEKDLSFSSAPPVTRLSP